jgi:release factor glutamine methyltransferase
MVETTVTIREALGEATARLADAGCESPRLDAELLLAAALGVTRTELFLRPTGRLDDEAAETFEAHVTRRAAREPVAYVLGVKAFRRLSLALDPSVLIPRPETELLVEYGLGLPHGSRVLDVGCGSGAVALALKDERPDLEVSGSDISAPALAVARGNAERLGLDVRFVLGDLLPVDRRWDAVLANLPYVADGDALEPEIALFEPAGALFGGPDGLALIRRLVDMLGEVPAVALEVGAGQSVEVSALLGDAGFRSVSRLRDLAGLERVVVGIR